MSAGRVRRLLFPITRSDIPDRMTSFLDQARQRLSRISGTIALKGLNTSVEVLRDTWGIPHIYAQTQDDLFFAQGFVAAQDRLWQMEMWRRAGEGRLAEILGPAALERDIFARLIRYRGDMDAEWISYAPDARSIVESFVRGVNAFIEHTGDNLPVEFERMGFKPEPWTPEVCLTRLAGYDVSRGLSHEVLRALLIRHLGAGETARLMPPEPSIPLDISEGLDLEDLGLSILSGHRAGLGQSDLNADAGSNNWVVNGARSVTGLPLLANDPHRAIALPSLRYTVHLVGPGWNVIGSGEPALPGVALGHNEKVAFGFTIFMADNQDLYVEQTHAQDATLYRSGDVWLPMEIEKHTFHVKGHPEPLEIPLNYTRHGPVIYEDRRRRRAFALRWTGSAPGTAGYLASLSLNRVSNWNEFLAALERWKQPTENLIYADVNGNIGYQVAGLVPRRTTWTGALPVPGHTGANEWEGYLQMDELPGVYNPPEGYIVTANHRTLAPEDTRAIGYDWDPGYRFRRIDEVIRTGGVFSVEDFIRLQEDVVSLPALELIKLLEPFRFETEPMRTMVERLRNWDGGLTINSPEASVYEMWTRHLVYETLRPRLPDSLWPLYLEHFSINALIALLKQPDTRFGDKPEQGRDRMLKTCLITAIMELTRRYGPKIERWGWGRLHTVTFTHPLSTRDTASFLDRGPYPRGGDGYTVNNTSDPIRSEWVQTGGASYRQVLDPSDWDRSMAINAPGQSGQPGSTHYDDLIPLWTAGTGHRLLYSRKAVEEDAVSRLILQPQERVPHEQPTSSG